MPRGASITRCARAEERERERERSRRAIRRDPAGSGGRGRGVINEAPGAARGISLRLGLGGPIKPLIGLARFLRALERSSRASESPQGARERISFLTDVRDILSSTNSDFCFFFVESIALSD